MKVDAPAKVNLGLSVLARRGDGFHEVETLFARLDLADSLEVELASDRPGEVTLTMETEVDAGAPDWFGRSLAAVPTGPENLVVRAAGEYLDELRQTAGGDVPGLSVALTKRVPVSAGLGGGSSDAAAVLLALAELVPAGLDLRAMGARLGSDVPYFLTREPAALARGRGERLAAVSVPRLALVLAKPDVAVSAAEAYESLVGFTPRLKHEAAFAALAAGEEPRWRNGLQPGVSRRYPVVRGVLEELRGLGLKGCIMSGSGPTCLGVAPSLEDAAGLASELRAKRPDLWVMATST